MKIAILALYTLYFIALAAAAPKPTKLHFRNLYKQPVGEIKTKINPRIIGGQEAEPHSIPYQAFLEVYAITEAWYCGGSLISKNYVLTAAHCNDDGQQALVTLGAHKALQIEDTQVNIVSNDIIVHEDYDAELMINDVAVIKLPEPVELTDAIQIVRLPSHADETNDYVGVTARVSGWGVTDGFSDSLSDVLNYVDVEVVTNEECEDVFGDLPASNICASIGSCSGDSGGPLMHNGTQIGIVSFGMIFCLPGYPSGFARVTSFLPWIAENTDVEIS